MSERVEVDGAKPADSGRVTEALRQIQHSIQQARIPGNDWRRELALIENTVDAALATQGPGEKSRDFMVDDAGYFHFYAAPPASPAGVPDALRVWAMAEGAPAGDPMYEAARGHVREMLKAAPSAPESNT